MYDRHTWALGVSGGTALNAVRLNEMETGIADAHDALDLKADVGHTHADVTGATSSNVVDTIVLRDSEGGFAATRITGLSTATSSSGAVPKSQLDAAISALAGTAHTHVVADITDISTVGANLVEAVDAETARLILDVDASDEVDTKIASAAVDAVADAATYTDSKAVERDTAIAAATDRMIHHMVFAVGDIPLRPDTSGTNQTVDWTGPAAASLPTNGTSSGGTAASAPGDRVFEF